MFFKYQFVQCLLNLIAIIIPYFFRPFSQAFEFDHHYPKSVNKSVAVVLYGKIGSRSFRILHEQLEYFAKYENVDYVLRHYFQVQDLCIPFSQ